MTPAQFLNLLQKHAASFADAVATNEGEWIIKGFIDIHQRIYSISVDTKIVSKVLELLLFPMFSEFATKHKLQMELCQHQNFGSSRLLMGEDGLEIKPAAMEQDADAVIGE